MPRNARPNPVRARLRSLLLLAVGGASVIVTTVLSALGAAADTYGAAWAVSVRAAVDRAGHRAERDAVHGGVQGTDRPPRHHPADPRRRDRRLP